MTLKLLYVFDYSVISYNTKSIVYVLFSMKMKRMLIFYYSVIL